MPLSSRCQTWLNLKTHTVSETENRASCLTLVSQTITVSSCHSDISNQCRIKKPCITGMAEKVDLGRGGGSSPLCDIPSGCPAPPPPPHSGVEFLKVPKAPKKIFGLKYLAPKVPEKNFDWPNARKKIWPNLKGRWGGGGGGWVQGGGWCAPSAPPFPHPQWC